MGKKEVFKESYGGRDTSTRVPVNGDYILYTFVLTRGTVIGNNFRCMIITIDPKTKKLSQNREIEGTVLIISCLRFYH